MNINLITVIVLVSFVGFAYAEEAHSNSLLHNMTYHGEDVADVQDGETWTAVIPDGDKYVAKRINIRVETVADVIFDSKDGPYTAKEISSHPDAVFLLKGISLSDSQIIRSYGIHSKNLYEAGAYSLAPEKQVRITGGKAVVILQGKGGITLKNADYNTNDAYQLFINVNGTKMAITEVTQNDESFPQLLWAGDLNEDDYPDLLIDISDHYNVSHPALFLSKQKNDRIEYEKVAERRSTGC